MHPLIVVGAWLLCLTMWLWLILCIDKVRVQRAAIIAEIRAWGFPNYSVGRMITGVTFDQHLRYVMTFRDWRKLYPKLLARRASLALYGVA